MKSIFGSRTFDVSLEDLYDCSIKLNSKYRVTCLFGRSTFKNKNRASPIYSSGGYGVPLAVNPELVSEPYLGKSASIARRACNCKP